MPLLQQLMDYGLDRREASIYLYLAEHLESTAFAIAKATNIPRATVYLLLESLKKKKMISTAKRNNVTYFLPESFNRLKKDAQIKIELADLIVPQLHALSNNDSFSPALKMYSGKEGLKDVFDDMLETIEREGIKHIHAISASNTIQALPKFLPEWIKQRENLSVFTYMIAEQQNGNVPYESNKLREVRILPRHISFDCSINLYGNKTACFSVNEKEIHGAIIESSTITNTLRQVFRVLWESLEK